MICSDKVRDCKCLFEQTDPEYPCLAKSKYCALQVVATGEGKKEGGFEGFVLVGAWGHTKGSFNDNWDMSSFTFEPL
jgi:hypothetical protein